MRYLLTKMISTDDEMFPAQAAASATALREKRGTGAGPRWEEETLREASSLFLDRAWWLVDGWREEGREKERKAAKFNREKACLGRRELGGVVWG